jgi:hypothetical protein
MFNTRLGRKVLRVEDTMQNARRRKTYRSTGKNSWNKCIRIEYAGEASLPSRLNYWFKGASFVARNA